MKNNITCISVKNGSNDLWLRGKQCEVATGTGHWFGRYSLMLVLKYGLSESNIQQILNCSQKSKI